MIIYEIVTIITVALASGMCGVFYAMKRRLESAESTLEHHTLEIFSEATSELTSAKDVLDAKVKEFADVTKEASEANNSMGNMLADIENRVIAIDERMSMLQGTATNGAGQKSWQQQRRP